MFPARAPSNIGPENFNLTLLGVEPGEDRHAGTQAGYQLALLVTTLAVSILGGLITGKVRMEGSGKGFITKQNPLNCGFQWLNNYTVTVGAIVNFLPAFSALYKEHEYFDDKLYWEVNLQ